MEEAYLTSKRNTYLRYVAVFVGLAIALAFLLAWNISAGSVAIPVRDVFKFVCGEKIDETFAEIILSIRLPRLIAAMLLGGALSVSGFLLQAFFHNPIAGPFVLGISSGAKMIVALVMVVTLGQGIQVNSATLIGAAFAGSMLSMWFILLISKKANGIATLIVGGVMIGYICSAVTDFVVTFASDADIVNLHNWSMGSFSGTSWKNIGTMTVVVTVAFCATFLMSKPIAAYQHGEVYAKSVGVNTKLFRWALIVLSGLLSGCVTAFAGPISFVGIAVPHLVKGILRTAKPILVIPACFLGGAVCCLFCDLIARTVFAPTEVNISSVTAIFGAPIVIVMMLQKKRNR